MIEIAAREQGIANLISESGEKGLYAPLNDKTKLFEDIDRAWKELRFNVLRNCLLVLSMSWTYPGSKLHRKWTDGERALSLSFIATNISPECADHCRKELGVTGS